MKKEEIKEKIQALLSSNDDANFELALILARQNNIDMHLDLYASLAKWVEEHNFNHLYLFSQKEIIQHFHQLKAFSFDNKFESNDLLKFPQEFMNLMPNLEEIYYFNLHSPIYINIPNYFQHIPKLKAFS